MEKGGERRRREKNKGMNKKDERKKLSKRKVMKEKKKMLKGKVKQKRSEKTKMIFLELNFREKKVKGEKGRTRNFKKQFKN